MTVRDRWIDKHLWRLRFGQFLQRAIEWVAVYLLLFGVTIFLVRRMAPSLWPHVLWVAVGVLPLTALAWWMSQAGRFTRTESVALLDKSLGAGGLLMTLTEAPDVEWESRLPQVEQLWRSSLPRFRFDRVASFVLPPLVFAVAVCYAPLKKIEAARVVKNTVGQQATAQLENLLEALDESEILEAKERETLADAIAQLKQETERSPLTHEKWETVDALEQRLRMRLEEANIDLSSAAQAAAMLAKAAGADGGELSANRVLALEEEMFETLMKMSKTGQFKRASASLQNELQRLIKAGKLELPQDLNARKQLLDDLSKFLDEESAKLAELRGEAGDCEQCGQQCDANGDCQNGECAACNKPGQGGISRGRGDAELTWGEESEIAGLKFKEIVLPPGLEDDPKDQIEGITRSAPEVDPADSVSRTAKRDTDPTAGRETWDRTLRPRHRGVVKKYFDSSNDNR